MSEPENLPPENLRNLPLFRSSTEPAPPPPAARHLAGPGYPSHISVVPGSAQQPPGAAQLPTQNNARPAEQPAPRKFHSIDWPLVTRLQAAAAKQLARLVSDRLGMDLEERRAEGLRIVRSIVEEQSLQELQTVGRSFAEDEKAGLIKAIMDLQFGLGRLQPFVEDHDIENIEVYGHDRVIVEHAGGRLEQIDEQLWESNEELLDFIGILAARSAANERPFSPANPTLHLRLDGGERLAASAWITPFPVMNIRRHRYRNMTLDELAIDLDVMTPLMAQFLSAAVLAGKNIVVIGGQGSGKTLMLRAMATAIPKWEKVGVIETEAELMLEEETERHPRCIPWEAKPGTGDFYANGTRAGEYGLDKIIADSFRFNLNRLICGEVRSREIHQMFQAMQTGAGSLSSLHAKNPRIAVSRMITLSLEATPNGSDNYAERQVVENIDLIVHIADRHEVGPDGKPRRRRWVDQIASPVHSHGSGAGLTTVFQPDPAGGHARPYLIPEDMEDLYTYGLDQQAWLTAVQQRSN